MAHCVVNNTYRKIKSRFATIGQVHRKIIKRFVVVGGVYKLVWSATSKVKAVFNGYSYAYSYSNPGGTGDTIAMYDADTKKTKTRYSILAFSRDGQYYIKSDGVFTCADDTQVTTGAFKSADVIKSTSVNNIPSASIRAVTFSPDSSRFCYAFVYRTTSSTTKYSIALVFWKFNKDTGKFAYEKDICLCKDSLYSSSDLIDFCISDDFSTIACSWRSASESWNTAIYKGSPNNGYTTLLLNTYAVKWVSGEVHVDRECGEYVTLSAGIYYISGNTATHLGTAISQVDNLSFSYDRSTMYLECGGYTDGTILQVYSISGPTITLLGRYDGSDYFSIFDENAAGETLFAIGRSKNSRTLYQGTLTKNASGMITDHTTVRDLGNSGYITSLNANLIRFYCTKI